MGQLSTGYCDCPDAVWVLPTYRAPVKLEGTLVVVATNKRARGKGPFDVLEDRAVVISTETMPPLARR